MAYAKVVKEGKGSFLVQVKKNALQFGGRLAYVDKLEGWETGKVYEIEDGFVFAELIIDGEKCTTEDGQFQLYTLEWED